MPVLFYCTALLLLFCKTSQLFTFDYDQEFYAYEYIKIATQHKLTLLGMETSVGGLFVGPLYTYFSSIVYWLANGSPMGMFVVTLLIAAAQPALTYLLFRRLSQDRRVGVIGGLLVLFSVSLWSKAYAPSVIIFLYPSGLLFWYILTKLPTNKTYILWLGLLLGISFHLHFSLFLFIPIVFVFIFLKKLSRFIGARKIIGTFLLVILFISPFVMFDLRHNFLLLKNIVGFMTQQTYAADQLTIPHHLGGVFQSAFDTFTHAVTVRQSVFAQVVVFSTVLFAIIKRRKYSGMESALVMWGVTFFLFLLYHGGRPDYYFFFLLPAFFYCLAIFSNSVRPLFFRATLYIFLVFSWGNNLLAMSKAYNPYNYFIKSEAVSYIKSQTQVKAVKILYDTDLGLSFGFKYLLDFVGVNQDLSKYEAVYQIVLRPNNHLAGKEFRIPNSPNAIFVVKLPNTL